MTYLSPGTGVRSQATPSPAFAPSGALSDSALASVLHHLRRALDVLSSGGLACRPYCAANVWQCQAGCSAEQPVAMMLGRAPGKLGAVATTAEIAKAVGMPARNVSRALAEWVAARRVRRLARGGGTGCRMRGWATGAETGSP
jgi:hypothetical protein